MANATLETYIDTYRNNGVPENVMRSNLLKMGWSDAEINECLAEMEHPYSVFAEPAGSVSRETTPTPARERILIPKKILAPQNRSLILILLTLLLAAVVYIFWGSQ